MVVFYWSHSDRNLSGVVYSFGDVDYDSDTESYTNAYTNTKHMGTLFFIYKRFINFLTREDRQNSYYADPHPQRGGVFVVKWLKRWTAES